MHTNEPQTPRSSEHNLTPLSADMLVRRSTIQYGVMLAVSLAIIHFGHGSTEQILTLPAQPRLLALYAAIGILGAALLQILGYFFEDWFASFRQLKVAVTHLLGPISVGVALYLAMLSAFTEELLFRGALQPFAGLFFTSALFGLLHMGAGGALSAWSLWAFLSGLLLGYMSDETGSLWPSILTHFGVNAISLLKMRHTWRSWRAHIAAQGKDPGST